MEFEDDMSNVFSTMSQKDMIADILKTDAENEVI